MVNTGTTGVGASLLDPELMSTAVSVVDTAAVVSHGVLEVDAVMNSISCRYFCPCLGGRCFPGFYWYLNGKSCWGL